MIKKIRQTLKKQNDFLEQKVLIEKNGKVNYFSLKKLLKIAKKEGKIIRDEEK